MFTAPYYSMLRESIAWMVSTTKKCIWQANPLVREGTNFLYVSIIPAEDPTIADIQRDLHGAVLLDYKFLQISIKKVIDLETFGLPNGSKASSRCLSYEINEKH